jgi:hypothetical protein
VLLEDAEGLGAVHFLTLDHGFSTCPAHCMSGPERYTSPLPKALER